VPSLVRARTGTTRTAQNCVVLKNGERSAWVRFKPPIGDRTAATDCRAQAADAEYASVDPIPLKDADSLLRLHRPGGARTIRRASFWTQSLR